MINGSYLLDYHLNLPLSLHCVLGTLICIYVLPNVSSVEMIDSISGPRRPDSVRRANITQLSSVFEAH